MSVVIKVIFVSGCPLIIQKAPGRSLSSITWVDKSAAAGKLVTVKQVWGHSSATPLEHSPHLVYGYLTAKPAVNLNMKKVHLISVQRTGQVMLKLWNQMLV